VEPADPIPRRPVPAVPSSFVGRSDELAALTELVARDRLVTVVGPGGCGKSRLVVEFVRAAELPVLGFVELAALSPTADLAAAVSVACGVREEPDRSTLEALRTRFDRVGGLLVMDNCEHLRGPAAALVDDLLRTCAGLRVLATSRAGLTLPGERVLPLTGLDPHESMVLLLDRARGLQPALAVDDGVAREICRLADGLPLAIELAAAHARSLPLAAIRDGMAERLGFLSADRPGRHGSVTASLDWSVDVVGGPARAALAALSVVDGRFPLEVALAVTGDRDVVEALVDQSLVQFDATDERYLLLETVRSYAAERLVETGAAEAAHGRLLEWAAGFARDTRAGLEHADPAVLRRVERADAAVSSALDRAVATGNGLDTAAAIVVDLAFGWSLRGRCRDGLAHVQRLAAALDLRAPAALRWAHAFLAIYSGDLELGFGLSLAAAAQAGADGWTAARARILTGLVQAFPDPAGADPVLAEAVVLARAAGDDWGEVEASQVRAYACPFRGRLEEALSCADDVVPALDRLGHGQLRAWDAAIRADVATSTGRFADGERFGRCGYDLAVAVGEPVSAFGSLSPLIRSLVHTGRSDEAQTVLAAGLDFLDTHPGLGTASAAALLRAVVASTGEVGAAIAAAQTALSVNADVPAYAGEAAVLLATARFRAGDADGAREAVDAAAARATQLGDPGATAVASLVGAALDRAAGRDATAAFGALSQLHAAGRRPLVVDGLELVGALARDAGREAVAARLHGAAERLRAELGTAVSPLRALLRPDARFLAAHAAEVAAGGRLGQVGAVGYALRNRGRRGRPRTGWESLTPAERDVVALAATGRSNQEIARGLLVSPGTVRAHLRSVYAKLGLANRVELAAFAAGRDL
jgi:predicted ATPase/DNA-binding CsgD family transcriptional regulator